MYTSLFYRLISLSPTHGKIVGKGFTKEKEWFHITKVYVTLYQ